MSSRQERTLLSTLHRNGCFSRPEETQESFLLATSSWFLANDDHAWDYPQVVKKTFSDRFGIDLQKIPVEVSAKGLMPWELACCWIDQDGHGTIQVRPYDRSQKIIHSEVILTHEAIHAVRGRLFSKKYEEHCAYAACHDAFPHTFPFWRAFLGPLFTSPKEVILLLLAIWGTWGIPILLDWDIPFTLLFCLSLIPLLFPFARLLQRWREWNKAMKNIAFEWPHKKWELIIRLTDDDVEWLASLRKKQVRKAVIEKAASDWRWEYFLEDILDECL
jgi:hypothetical protein